MLLQFLVCIRNICKKILNKQLLQPLNFTMGCVKSKVKVVPQQTVEAWTSTDGAKKPWKRSPKRRRGSNESVKIRSRKNSKGDTIPNGPTIIHVQESKSNNNSDGGSSHYSSRESINSSRTGSASSTITKSSAKSNDSGLGDEYSHVITEKSPMADKEAADLPPDITTPNLTLRGQKLKTIPPLSHRRRSTRLPPIKKRSDIDINSNAESPSLMQKRVSFANSLINELPESPSIIKRPSSRGGMAFDIMMADTSSESAPKRRPTQLQRLEKKHDPVTLKDLVEKQRDAKMRREGHEQMRLERIRAQKEKDRQVSEALAKFAAMQMEIKAEVENKMKTTSENREAHLKVLCDRLKEKSDKVQEVKKAKKTRKLTPLRPLRHPSVMRQSIEEKPVNLGAN